MKAIKSASPIHLNDLTEFNTKLSVNLLRAFQIKDFRFIGSFGKKELMNDIDVAVLGDFEYCSNQVKSSGLEYKILNGFKQISFGFPFKNQIVQVDLMFSKNLDWSEFIYYSPNLLKQESQYKGVYRNLLLNSICKIETQNWIDEYSYEQFIYRHNDGFGKVLKTHLSDSGNRLKTPRVLNFEHITFDPKQMYHILGINGCPLTFEQLHTEIKDRLKYADIMSKFKQDCKDYEQGN